MPRIVQTCFVVLLFAASLPLRAAEQGCRAESDACVAVGRWELALGIGLGARSNPVVDGEAMPIVLLPKISYYGERFFFDTNTLGFTLAERRAYQLNLIATVGYDQMYFRKWSLGNLSVDGSGRTSAAIASDYEALVGDQVVQGDIIIDGSGVVPPQLTLASDGEGEVIDLDNLHRRAMAGLAGLEYSHYAGNFSLNLQALQDFSGVHNGRELRSALAYNWRQGRSTYTLSGGVEWRDARVQNYYFGVAPSEVSNPNNAYRAGSGASTFAKVDWRYQLSAKWQLQLTLHQRWLSDEIVASPLIDDDSVTTFFVGGVRHF